MLAIYVSTQRRSGWHAPEREDGEGSVGLVAGVAAQPAAPEVMKPQVSQGCFCSEVLPGQSRAQTGRGNHTPPSFPMPPSGVFQVPQGSSAHPPGSCSHARAAAEPHALTEDRQASQQGCMLALPTALGLKPYSSSHPPGTKPTF